LNLLTSIKVKGKKKVPTSCKKSNQILADIFGNNYDASICQINYLPRHPLLLLDQSLTPTTTWDKRR